MQDPGPEPNRGAAGRSRAFAVPDKPALEGLEEKWRARWEADGVYRFDRSKPRSEIYAIDTPPPTVSGSLHIGHVFSYTHTDVIARFQRMRGREVFYPMGWDDNGLPTERRVQNYYGVRCDPALPYDPSFVPPDLSTEAAGVRLASELHRALREADGRRRKGLRAPVALSGLVGRLVADLRDDRPRSAARCRSSPSCTCSSAASRIRSKRRRSGTSTSGPPWLKRSSKTARSPPRTIASRSKRPVRARAERRPQSSIETTRPELIPACVALVAHPDDERYKPLFGSSVVTPLFGVEIPVRAHTWPIRSGAAASR